MGPKVVAIFYVSVLVRYFCLRKVDVNFVSILSIILLFSATTEVAFVVRKDKKWLLLRKMLRDNGNNIRRAALLHRVLFSSVATSVTAISFHQMNFSVLKHLMIDLTLMSHKIRKSLKNKYQDFSFLGT